MGPPRHQSRGTSSLGLTVVPCHWRATSTPHPAESSTAARGAVTGHHQDSAGRTVRPISARRRHLVRKRAGYTGRVAKQSGASPVSRCPPGRAGRELEIHRLDRRAAFVSATIASSCAAWPAGTTSPGAPRAISAGRSRSSTTRWPPSARSGSRPLDPPGADAPRTPDRCHRGFVADGRTGRTGLSA